MIAFSDPYTDTAEVGGPTAGRVLNGSILPHAPIPGHPSNVHNDAGNVSHDYYAMVTVPVSISNSIALWGISNYGYNPLVDPTFEKQNCPQEFTSRQMSPADTSTQVVVEYALAMSPFTWKPGGEWVDTLWEEKWITEFWRYEDDGDSCLPDFMWDVGQDWVFDGPVSVANSFWWFDSKAETLKTGGWPVAPPAISDHYSMTVAYEAWDDHDTQNTTPFINDLKDNYLDTSIKGTTAASMTEGIEAWLGKPGVAGDFYTDTQDAPAWEWIADEVETCEDVILLLGFYEDVGGEWKRKGGHWVNAAGVNRDNLFIGLSDPAIDQANNDSISNTLYLGRVFPPEHLGTPFSDAEKKTPQNISHDIYRIAPHSGTGAQLLLADYPFTSTSVVSNYVGLNGGGQAVVDWQNPMVTVVDWAIGVSPHSDLVITKTAVVTEVVAGDRVTYTLEYANAGLAAAEKVVISDALPVNVLTGIAQTSYPPIQFTPGPVMMWTRPKLSYGQTGTITITGESLVTGILTNTVTITGLNAIGDPTPDRNLSDNISTVGPPCVQVEQVEMTMISPEPILAGSAVEFEADISPDDAGKPYYYRLTVDGIAGSVQTASNDPLTFEQTFATSGTHTVEIAVWNCIMSQGNAKRDSVEVQVTARLPSVYLPIILKVRQG